MQLYSCSYFFFVVVCVLLALGTACSFCDSGTDTPSSQQKRRERTKDEKKVTQMALTREDAVVGLLTMPKVKSKKKVRVWWLSLRLKLFLSSRGLWAREINGVIRSAYLSSYVHPRAD
jgi:hypothetical protein